MNEDLENYEITPDDLGCMGEKEIDDGVKEVTGTPEKKEVRKSFASIPLDKKKRARKLYDGFDDKDMSFEDFCCELYALESPKLMQADLRDVMEQKHGGYRAQAAADYAFAKHRLN